MTITNIIYILLIAFTGYLAGRWGDYYLNFWMKDPSWAPHHWIYGLILIIAGFFFRKSNWGLWIMAFGVGLFISDLKDFLNLKFWGSDGKSINARRFWDID